MSKYRLVSEYGNQVVYTDNEREKTTLLERGFHIENLETKKQPTRKRKVVIEDERNIENKDRTEGDI